MPLATKSYKFSKLPQTSLFVTICRFYFNRATVRKEKLCTPVKVPETLTIDGQLFKLNGVVVHAGRSSNAGHYYTIAKSGERWNLCNDSSVSGLGGSNRGEQFKIEAYINKSIGGAFASDTPYMLSYERVLTS